MAFILRILPGRAECNPASKGEVSDSNNDGCERHEKRHNRNPAGYGGLAEAFGQPVDNPAEHPVIT